MAMGRHTQYRSAFPRSLSKVLLTYSVQTARELKFDNFYAVKANAFLYLKSCSKQFDMIFSDAPYDLEGSEAIIDIVFERDLLAEDGIFIFEHSKDKDFKEHPNFWQLRSYGSVQFSFFKK